MSVASVLWRILGTHQRDPLDVMLTACCPYACPVARLEITMHVDPRQRQPQTLVCPLCQREAQLLAATPLA